MRLRTRSLIMLWFGFAAGLVRPAAAAGPDGNVEWVGVSHYTWQDRRPVCPVNGESFQVRFQTYQNDLTSAVVVVNAGAGPLTVSAARIGTRGPYDLWAAQLPAIASNTESYWIELTDGALTDYLSPAGASHTVPASGYPIDFTTFVHAPPGATLVNGGAVVFKVWAPNVAQAFVRGQFNAWGTLAMLKTGEYFTAKALNVTDRSEYKFFFPTRVADGGYAPDPNARAFNSPASYNSIVENPFRFTWTDEAFATPPAEKLVVYQLHIGTFSGLNDPVGTAPNPARYSDVTARVAHLKSLGVNAVQLCPVNEFPGDLSAGYNPVSNYAPEWKYGTADEFKAMVNTLHRNGIAVLLDIVWNHFSPTDNYLWNYDGTQSWFDTPDVTTPWGSQAAFGRAGVADHFAHNAHYWFSEFHLDGFRMDATSFMTPGTHSLSGWQLMQRLNNEKNNRWADKITVAEQLPSDPIYSTPTNLGGAGFDVQYSMLFRDNIRNAVFAAAFGDPSMNSVRSALLGNGPWLSGVHAYHYVQLHDEAWPSSGGQRLVKTIDPTAPHDDIWARGRTMLALGLTLSSAGVPAFLQGDEWLESNPFNPAPDLSGRIDWAKKTTNAGVFAFYQRLIGLRTTLAPLFASSGTLVYHVNEAGNVIGFRRTDGNGTPMVVIANFSNTDYPAYQVGFPQAGTWVELVNSQDPLYGGSGPVNAGTLTASGGAYDGFNQSLTLALPKMTFAVYAPLSFVGVEPPAPAPSHLELATPWPNPSRAHAALRFALPERATVRLAIYDVSGRELRVLSDGMLEAGAHAMAWDGRDGSGRPSGPGLYFARLSTPLGQRSVRLVRLP